MQASAGPYSLQLRRWAKIVGTNIGTISAGSGTRLPILILSKYRLMAPVRHDHREARGCVGARVSV